MANGRPMRGRSSKRQFRRGNKSKQVNRIMVPRGGYRL